MSRTRRSWLPKWLANPRTGRARSARLRVEEMERRITPATFYSHPPSSTPHRMTPPTCGPTSLRPMPTPTPATPST